MSELCSVIIPVYNSEKTLEAVVAELVQQFETMKVNYELILVNDSSHDSSLRIMNALSDNSASIKSFNLERNIGQHAAILVGMKQAEGKYIFTLDDDLQNPASEIPLLRVQLMKGSDLVFGKFKQKKHSRFRILGSSLVGFLNVLFFDKPSSLVLSNFRGFTKEVKDRVLQTQLPYSYLPGLLLISSKSPVNVEVEHRERVEGRSQYTFTKLLGVVYSLMRTGIAYRLKLSKRSDAASIGGKLHQRTNLSLNKELS